MKNIKASTFFAGVIIVLIAGIVFIIRSTGTDDTQIVIDENTENVSSETGSEIIAETDATEEPGSESTTICVYVCGAVNEPGVYYLDEDARVYQAVEMAGGAAEDAAVEYLNMAGTLVDGQQVYVPTAEEVSDGSASLPSTDLTDASGGDDGKININTATAEELCTITGIGQARAEAIIAYREANGYFESIEDICNVSGIKDATFEKIKDQIKV